jgi:hypothetical protein
MTRGWWTEADAAELGYLVWELVGGYFEHRERCRACRPDARPSIPCPHLRVAISEVLDWRAARVLLSRAQALRAELEERAA